jgi:hypothetical protein
MSHSASFDAAALRFTLDLPPWAVTELNALPTHMTTPEERMAAVLRFARLNFEHETGGPFAAGVFERDSGRLVVIGVNRVLASHCSSAHVLRRRALVGRAFAGDRRRRAGVGGDHRLR